MAGFQTENAVLEAANWNHTVTVTPGRLATRRLVIMIFRTSDPEHS